ncbi:MAG: hypothetical protein ACOY4O_01780 [Pseudomonadota bacterium]
MSNLCIRLNRGGFLTSDDPQLPTLAIDDGDIAEHDVIEFQTDVSDTKQLEQQSEM